MKTNKEIMEKLKESKMNEFMNKISHIRQEAIKNGIVITEIALTKKQIKDLKSIKNYWVKADEYGRTKPKKGQIGMFFGIRMVELK